MFGTSGSKTDSSSKTNQSQTIVPTNPDWVTSGLAGIGDTLSKLGGADPYSFTAGADPLQTQAGGEAGILGQLIPGALSHFDNNTLSAMDSAGSLVNAKAPQMTAAAASPFISNYMNPYTDAVVKSSLAGFDQNAGLQNAQANLDQAGDSTFGGSGGSIYKALLNQGLALDRGQLESGLWSQGFTQALGAAQQDADRAQQASLENANLHLGNRQLRLAAGAQQGSLANQLLNGTLSADANTRSDIATQGSMGDMLRQIQLQHSQAPLSLLGDLSQVWGNLPLDLLHGQNGTLQSTTKGSGTSFGVNAST